MAVLYIIAPAAKAPRRWRPLNSNVRPHAITPVLYSAADAPLAIGRAFFLLPHLLLGGALLATTLNGKVWFSRMPKRSSLSIQAVFGALFFGVALFALGKDINDTFACRSLAKATSLPTAEGPIVVRQVVNRVSESVVVFSVGATSFSTFTRGRNDCGYVQPLGQVVSIKDGLRVRVFAAENTILRMEHQ